VLALAGALRALGIGAGDRVACMSSNAPPAIVACLAATALGAVWSSVAPDLGTEATRDRFAQLEPKAAVRGARLSSPRRRAALCATNFRRWCVSCRHCGT